MEKGLAELRRRAGSVEGLHQQRRELQAKAERLTEGISEAGHSPAPLAKLAQVEVELASIDNHISAVKPVNISATPEEIRQFVSANIRQLRRDVSASREVLMRHLGQLILTPTETPGGPVYAVPGGVTLETGTNVIPCDPVPGHHPPLRVAPFLKRPLASPPPPAAQHRPLVPTVLRGRR